MPIFNSLLLKYRHPKNTQKNFFALKVAPKVILSGLKNVQQATIVVCDLWLLTHWRAICGKCFTGYLDKPGIIHIIITSVLYVTLKGNLKFHAAYVMTNENANIARCTTQQKVQEKNACQQVTCQD